MPGVVMPLPRLKQHDACPAAHMRHTGLIPRAAHGIAGSTATRVPTGMSQSGPASITRPAISWPSRNGNVQKPPSAGALIGRLPNRCRSLPQMPPTVTATRAHSPLGSSGSSTSTSSAPNAGILQVELDRAHAVILDQIHFR